MIALLGRFLRRLIITVKFPRVPNCTYLGDVFCTVSTLRRFVFF